MGYLAINMSGQNMSVYSNFKGGNRIGTIYHKERFSHLGTVSYDGATVSKIKFLNSSGYYVLGYCWPGSNQANDWSNYLVRSEYVGQGFMTDAITYVYDSAGQNGQKVPAGSFVKPCHSDYTEIGTNHPDWMRVQTIACSDGSYMHVDYGFFIDCRIRENSTNTPVYGNWN